MEKIKKKYEVNDKNQVDKVKELLKDRKHVFVLIRRDGCPPCESTKPEWEEMSNIINADDNKYSKDELVVINFNEICLPDIKDEFGEVIGFPTMKYISKVNDIIESYEDSSIPVKDRKSQSFIDWIDSKLSKKGGGYDGNSYGVQELFENIKRKQRHSSSKGHPSLFSKFGKKNKTKTTKTKTKKTKRHTIRRRKSRKLRSKRNKKLRK